ncbi:MAG: hypothetical protein ACOYJ6_16025 [Caulobacterales bacterium]|jgi:hypothetical protein
MEALPEAVEKALATLETTTEYPSGEAALAIVNAHLRTTNWFRVSEVLLTLAASVGVGLIREIWPHLANFALVLLVLLLIGQFYVLGRCNIRQRKRALTATNRWDQIAGTLAVKGQLP